MVEGYRVEPKPGGAYLGYGSLSPRFNLQYDGAPFLDRVIREYRRAKGLPESDDLGSGLKEGDRAIIGARFAELLAEGLQPHAGPFLVSVQEKPPNINIEGSGVACCGPAGLDLVTLYGFAATAADQIVTWAALLVGVRSLIRRLRELTHQPVELDTGTAIIVAADAILGQTGERDLTLAFSTEVTGALSPSDQSGHPDGFAVGFRGDGSLRLALMDLAGERVVVRLVPMLWAGYD
ncbi:MAG: hypothetical protein ABSB75_05285 [Candidatus Limnocylindrales bacterium]